jgi:hypothetical protein
LRNVGVGDDYEPRAFNNFSAVAIASNFIPDAVKSGSAKRLIR